MCTRQYFFQFDDWIGGADTGNDVLSLCVHHKLAPKFVLACGRVAGECHAGTGIFAGVTEHHGLNINSRPPLGRDIVFAAIHNRTVVHP